MSIGGMRNFATVWFSWKKLVLEPSGGNVSSIICFHLKSSLSEFVIMAGNMKWLRCVFTDIAKPQLTGPSVFSRVAW